ncbi:MAG: hypothetical protein FWD82_08935 [Defluviitaleaceae bacterium]|nr:hypothetical protein [Defluviitaleaceae bacterium]
MSNQSVLDFKKYLEENEMTINGAEVSYKGKVMCYMHIGEGTEMPDPFTIWTDGDYSRELDNFKISDEMKEIAWANVNTCGSCGGNCSPGKLKTIFGKEFNNVCSADMAFYMPDAKSLECVKKLLEMRKLSE